MARKRFYVGHVHARRLFYDIALGSFPTFRAAQLKALASERGLTRVVIETKDLSRHGTVYGSSEVVRSPIDGRTLSL
jgi:hypothetical protein